LKLDGTFIAISQSPAKLRRMRQKERKYWRNKKSFVVYLGSLGSLGSGR
jgi:hypothetical protein